VDGFILGINPGDRSDVLGRFGFSESSVELSVAAARRGFAVWRRFALTDRCTALRRFREVMSKEQERLAMLVTRETGKPLWEARQEVIATLRVVDLLLDEGVALLTSKVLHETDARSDVVPHGVVAVLAPHNLPVLHPTLQTLAAMMSGNTVVLKPSKFTPGVGQAIAEIMDRCRLPRGVFNLVQGSGAVIGQRLASHPGVDALIFSGAPETAAAIHETLKGAPERPVMYQCGGKGCAIVVGGCNLEQAVYETLVGAYLTAGQRHNSTARAIVTADAYDAFCEQLMRRAAVANVGYGFDDDTFMGPVISENVRSRYRRFGESLSDEGHTALLSAQSLEATPQKGFYVSPALYTMAPSRGNQFLDDEPPGPLLMLYKVDSWEDAAKLHNKLLFRGSASVFVDPGHREIDEMTRRIRTGALNINRGTIGASQRLPAAGQGRAGNGLSSGVELLRFLTRPRALLVERRPFDPSHMVPGLNWELGDDEAPDITGALVADER
jgi:succinylglutamic semialdehyde dehydrogenase